MNNPDINTTDVESVKYSDDDYFDAVDTALDNCNMEILDLFNSNYMIGSDGWNMQASELFRNMQATAKINAMKTAVERYLNDLQEI